MRKILFFITVAVLSACSDDFLEIYPVTSLNEANFFTNQDDYINLVNGCYTPLRDYNKEAFWTLSELPSDNSSYQHNTADDGAFKLKAALDLFITVPENQYLQSFWSSAYRGIYSCNVVLEKIEKPDVVWTSEPTKKRCYGEAYFLRALYYFDLVRAFGDVPLVLKTINSGEAANLSRTPVAEIYAAMESDLKNAITNFADANSVHQNGRASWGAASSLLGKVYLYQQKYALAETQLKLVIDAKTYSLKTNYADVFNPSTKDFTETIFSVQYSEASVALSQRYIFWFAPHTSKGAVTLRPTINISNTNHGFNQPTNDLINAFEAGDLRKDVSIKFWTGADWDFVVRTIPYCAKYKPPVSSPVDRCGDNFPILRYSDVLLMYAEALNAQNKTADAIPYVEEVRTRAGLTNSLTGTSKDALTGIIEKERQCEFCFENQRWYDLKRTGRALTVMTSHAVREKAVKPWLITTSYQLDANDLLLPIPSQEVTANRLIQNPGY
jgi:hypothetical protein